MGMVYLFNLKMGLLSDIPANRPAATRSLEFFLRKTIDQRGADLIC